MDDFKKFTDAVLEDDIIKNIGTSHSSVVSDLDSVDLIRKHMKASRCKSDNETTVREIK